MQHTTVLLDEAVDALQVHEESVIVDATFGAGGHAQLIVSQLGKAGTYIGIDADATAFISHDFESTDATVHLVHNNFRHITEVISSLQFSEVDGILADLGWRMEQFAGGGKGFSFQHDEPLVMTFGEPEDDDFTAAGIVNDWDETVLADIIFGYGEERFARRIAKRIVEERAVQPISTSKQLADIVAAAVPVVARRGRIHPATKTFQAIRIAVNDELGALEQFITDGVSALAPEGRLAIITFHSLEDRIVKHRFRELAAADIGIVITKKPIVPSEEERKSNSRSRSAKLRILEKR